MNESSLDFVAHACMQLSTALTVAPSELEKETIILNHIKRVYDGVSPIDDFKKDLEWVNVSEPLSLSKHCSKKIVVLDFWTYCCINCFHVLADLAHLESIHPVTDGVVVIGVHTAKFDNEKASDNILAAVRKYGIRHPVVNDADTDTWTNLGICCWPTLLILGPGMMPLFVLAGEGHRDELLSFVSAAVTHFADELSPEPLPCAPDKHLLPAKLDGLLFPTKLALNPFYKGVGNEPYLAISDTGNHRIVLTAYSGNIVRIVGGPEPGFKDGKLVEARFDSPLGLCWLSSSVLAVCDAGNHALRTVHLDEGCVELLAGTGSQAPPADNGGKCLALQALSSPWDVVLFSTPDMDMSVRVPVEGEKGADKQDEIRRVLVIACAGSHQLWALFLDTTVWWKYNKYTEGTCVCIAGSGAEAARNSSYPMSAAFAQPSGLAVKTGPSPELFIADSESSSIRKLALSSGQVSAVAGGDRNPLNLFAFGDQDGAGYEAKFQHPLAVAYSEPTRSLYVADSYNHKIKRINLSNQKVQTLNLKMIESNDPVVLNEPSGLAVTPDSKYLYVADTNNHSIKIINLSKNSCQEFRVKLPEDEFVEPENVINYGNDLFVNRKGGTVIIYFSVNLDCGGQKDVKFTPGAPQNWSLVIRGDNNMVVTFDDFEFVNCTDKGSKLPGKVELRLKSKVNTIGYKAYLGFYTNLCEEGACFKHNFVVKSNILVRDSVKMVESYKLTCKINPVNSTKLKKEDTSSSNSKKDK